MLQMPNRLNYQKKVEAAGVEDGLGVLRSSVLLGVVGPCWDERGHRRRFASVRVPRIQGGA